MKTDAPIFMPGSGGVTDTGQATYSIPLWVPEGPQSAQPNLELTYRGRANGSLGVGFALSGLSSIAPCTKTFASEGFADGIDFGQPGEAGLDQQDIRDSYCLDGKKLVELASPKDSFPLGLNEKAFRTEVESFEHVVAHLPSSDAKVPPDQFIVYQRNGSTRLYKPVYASRLRPINGAVTREEVTAAVPIIYLLSEVTDRHNNRVVYKWQGTDAYNTHEVAFQIGTIEYSFVDGTPRRRIEFSYETRTDSTVKYVSGVRVVNRSRLTRIDMYAPNPTTTAKVWSYQLAYKLSGETGRSLLLNVKLCDVDNICSWVRSFDWREKRSFSTDLTSLSESEFDKVALGYDEESLEWYRSYTKANWLRPGDTRILLFDIDGDGDDDALYRRKPTYVDPYSKSGSDDELHSGQLVDYRASAGDIEARLSSATEPLSMKKVSLTDILEPGLVDQGKPPAGKTFAVANLGKSRIADMDGDGYLDLVLAKTRFTVSGARHEGDPYRRDDWSYGYSVQYGGPWDHVNGVPFEAGKNLQLDAVAMKGPVMRYLAELQPKTQFFAWQPPPFQWTAADADGDGHAELVGPFVTTPGDPNPPTPIDVSQNYEMDWFDAKTMNGAGYGYRTFLSTDGQLASFGQPWVCGNGNAVVNDVDGDGRQDVLVAGDTTAPGETDPVTSSVSTFQRLTLADPWLGAPPHGGAAKAGTSALWAGGCVSSAPDLVWGDWNGDGLTDVLYPPHQYGNNDKPVVRWNYGTGFGAAEPIVIEGAPELNDLLDQKLPMGRFEPVQWDRGTRVADVDGDGRSDILAFRQDNDACLNGVMSGLVQPDNFEGCMQKLIVYRSRGSRFVAEEIFSWGSGMFSFQHGFSTAQIGDVNGDGAVDAVTVANHRLQVLELPWRAAPDVIENVNDGSTPYALEQFDYTHDWWGDAPRAEATAFEVDGPHACAWPIACPRGGFEVVRQHRSFAGTKPDGSAMYRTQIHTYANPKISLIGRGSLGFAQHTIWDRESGRYTDRHFDNDVEVDTNPAWFGGTFYPYAGTATFETTTTPLKSVPSDADLQAATAAPGLASFTNYEVHTTWTSKLFDKKFSSDGRMLTILPSSITVDDIENTVQANVSSKTPSYGVGSPFGSGSSTTTRLLHDDYGHITSQVTDISDGQLNALQVTRSTTTEYQTPRIGTKLWHVDLPSVVTQKSFDRDDSIAPARVTRVSYDSTTGDVTSVKVAATGPAYPVCITQYAAESCETLGNVTYYTSRDSFGNPTYITTKAADVTTNRTTRISWDGDGVYPMTVTNPLGHQTTTKIHPAYGVPIAVTDELGITSLARYDGFARLRSATRPGAAGLTRSYSPVAVGTRRGLRIDEAHDDGKLSYARVDELGRTIESGRRGFDAATWSYEQTTYDVLGNVAQISVPSTSLSNPKWINNNYDRLGQLTATYEANLARTTYKPRLLSTTTTDPEGHISYVNRDPAGRTVESGHLVGGAPYGAVKFGYSAFDQTESVTDAKGFVTRLVHDELGRLATYNDPDAGLTTYRNDGYGQRTGETRANGDQYVRTYDVLGRLGDSTGPDGITKRVYDTGTNATGRPTRVESADGVVTSISYDSYGRPYGIVQTVNGISDSIYHRYDTYGRLKYLFYPVVSGQNRLTVSYNWANDGYLHSIADVSSCGLTPSGQLESAGASTCIGTSLWKIDSRDAFNHLVHTTFGNGIAEDRAYDPLTGRITSHNAGGTTTTYTFLRDGQLKTRRGENSRSESFQYDDLHRIQQWTLSWMDSTKVIRKSITDYSIDELGNLYNVATDGTTTFSATFATAGRPHRMNWSSVGGTHKYDGNGRNYSGGGRTITYAENDLPAQIVEGSTTRDFLYDGTGGRVMRSDATSTVRYMGKLFEHRTSTVSGTTDVAYVYGENAAIAQIDMTGTRKATRYLASDPLGTVSVVFAGPLGSQVVDEIAYYDPYGKRISENGTAIVDPDKSTSRGFGGHEHDTSDLVNMSGRIYDRKQFRFLTPDPVIGSPFFGQAYNPYSYVLNNPVNLTDPSGFDPEGGGGAEGAGADASYNDPLDEGSIGVEEAPGNVFNVTIIGVPPHSSDASMGSTATANVIQEEPWQPDMPISDAVRYGAGVAMDGNQSPIVRLLAGAGALMWVPFAINEHGAAGIVSTPHAIVTGLDASMQHQQRAAALDAVGADGAALDERLQMAGALALALADIAGLVTDISPSTEVTMVAKEAEAAEASIQHLLQFVPDAEYIARHYNPKQYVRPGHLFEEAKIAKATKLAADSNANGFKSLREQFLYAIYADNGRLLKYGTSKSPMTRYTPEKFYKMFGDGAYMELLDKGGTRVMRHGEQRLIRGHEFINGSKPPWNKAYH
ncbi:MAG TPA: RHS repeat-associated core domain-containing protein [Kofleriaceae bacterium]|nr:RHS repeat-associated core domain-containing protein [Kofleriaceae bacterium]